MDKNKVDYSVLENTLYAPKMYKYEDVKHQLVKIAFDVVVFRNRPEHLWQIQKGEDGNDYVVAMYGDEESVELSKSSWSVETDKFQKFATIFYKNTPVTNVNLQATKVADVEDFKARVPSMLENNKDLVKQMLGTLEDSRRTELVNMHPELV